MEKERIFCKICYTQTNLTIDSFSRYHLKLFHEGISVKEYYDLCIKKENEGICLECGKETKFNSYNKGYRLFCCNNCLVKSDYSKDKISKSYEIRDMKSELEKRQQTCLEKFGVDCYNKTEEFKERFKITCLKNFGVVHNFLTQNCIDVRWKVLNENKDEINEKRKKFWRNLTEDELNLINQHREDTLLKKYGVTNVSKINYVIDKIRKTNEKNGNWLNNNSLIEFLNYKKLVTRETKKHRIRLFKNWNGLDYYTGEKLNYNNNKLYPTVDHKISQWYGFINNIDPNEIGAFKNLCICSRSINARKSILIEKEFKENLNEK